MPMPRLSASSIVLWSVYVQTETSWIINGSLSSSDPTLMNWIPFFASFRTQSWFWLFSLLVCIHYSISIWFSFNYSPVQGTLNLDPWTFKRCLKFFGGQLDKHLCWILPTWIRNGRSNVSTIYICPGDPDSFSIQWINDSQLLTSKCPSSSTSSKQGQTSGNIDKLMTNLGFHPFLSASSSCSRFYIFKILLVVLGLWQFSQKRINFQN